MDNLHFLPNNILIRLFKKLKKNIRMTIVGSQFVAQAQKSWGMSPIQLICREWVRELGF